MFTDYHDALKSIFSFEMALQTFVEAFEIKDSVQLTVFALVLLEGRPGQRGVGVAC